MFNINESQAKYHFLSTVARSDIWKAMVEMGSKEKPMDGNTSAVKDYSSTSCGHDQCFSWSRHFAESARIEVAESFFNLSRKKHVRQFVFEQDMQAPILSRGTTGWQLNAEFAAGKSQVLVHNNCACVYVCVYLY